MQKYLYHFIYYSFYFIYRILRTLIHLLIQFAIFLMEEEKEEENILKIKKKNEKKNKTKPINEYVNMLDKNIKNSILNYFYCINIFFDRKLKKQKNINNINKSNKINILKFQFYFCNEMFTKKIKMNILNNLTTTSFSIYFMFIYKKTFGEGFTYIRGLFIIFFIDSLLIDDEPL